MNECMETWSHVNIWVHGDMKSCEHKSAWKLAGQPWSSLISQISFLLFQVLCNCKWNLLNCASLFSLLLCICVMAATSFTLYVSFCDRLLIFVLTVCLCCIVNCIHVLRWYDFCFFVVVFTKHCHTYILYIYTYECVYTPVLMPTHTRTHARTHTHAYLCWGCWICVFSVYVL